MKTENLQKGKWARRFVDLWYCLRRTANVLKNTVYPDEVTLALKKAVVYLDSALVEGDVAEFGCWSGRSAKKLSRALKGRKRTLHLFDSFDGLPRPTAAQDTLGDQVRLGLWAQGVFRGQTARSMAKACPKAVVHEGWYKDTVPRLDAALKFALIHIDCDLYSSTMDALAPLFARGQVAKGAVLLFDDWHTNQADNTLGERAAWRKLVGKFRIDFEDDGSYGWTQKRLIVHDYVGRVRGRTNQ